MMLPDQSNVRSYDIASSAQKAWPWFAGGFGAIVATLLGFVAAIFRHVGQFELQTMTTLPAMGAIALFVKGWSISKLPRQIDVSPQSLRIVRGTKGNTFDWETIGWVADDKTPLSQQRRLTVFDSTGKKVFAINDSFPAFDQVSADIKGEFAKRYGANNEAIRMRKARRTAIWMALGSLLLIGVAIGNLILAHKTARAKELLETKAIRGTAKVVRRFIAPNGRTRRLEYEVREANGLTGKRNAEVYSDFWDEMDGVENVDVVYVPGEPNISRLIVGEVMKEDISDNPKIMYGLCAVLCIFFVIFLVAAALLWRGWEFTFDSGTRRIKLKPFGTGK